MLYTYNRPKFENSEVYKIDYFNEETPETPLIDEIEAELPGLVHTIICSGDYVNIYTTEELSSEDRINLETIVENHS